jgi:hypothetical protein
VEPSTPGEVLHGIGLTMMAVLGAAIIAPDKPGGMLATTCKTGTKLPQSAPHPAN